MHLKHKLENILKDLLEKIKNNKFDKKYEKYQEIFRLLLTDVKEDTFFYIRKI